MNKPLKYHILERLEHLEIPESLSKSKLCIRFLYQNAFNQNPKSFFKGGYYVMSYPLLFHIIREFIHYLEFGCPTSNHSYVPYCRECDVQGFTSHQYFKNALECGALIIVCLDHVALIDVWKQVSKSWVLQQYIGGGYIELEEVNTVFAINPSRIGLQG